MIVEGKEKGLLHTGCKHLNYGVCVCVLQVKDFVKHGCNTGFVEITLCDDQASRHPVIRRTLSAESNSSKWTINRMSVNEKDVRKERHVRGRGLLNIVSSYRLGEEVGGVSRDITGQQVYVPAAGKS